MKTNLITTFVLCVVTGITLTFAQQSLRTNPFETKSKLGKHMSKRDLIFSEQRIPRNAPTSQHLFNKNQLDLNAIVPDFQVNENAGPNGASQRYASIATASNGNFVITWEDERNGESDIYAQRYLSDGTPIGNNFKVNDSSPELWMDCFPSISSDTEGNFVITWSAIDIYAQRYLSDGTPLGTNFKVNDGDGRAWYSWPAISTNVDGNFVITWADIRNEVWNLYAQRYLSNGTPMGSNFKVNDAEGSAEYSWPDISANSDGSFVITWDDLRSGSWENGDSDIYAQRYLGDGTPIGGNIKVNSDVGSTNQFSPAISINSNGNFVITWTDGRNRIDSLYNNDIYTQRYLSNGTPLGNNFKVNDDEGSFRQMTSPNSICTDSSGNFFITWHDERNGNRDIYVQRYLSDGTPLGTNFKVNDSTWGEGWYNSPAISTNANGNFVVTWNSNVNRNYDIFAQRYLNDGTNLGANFKINDDFGSSGQYFPSISPASNGNFVITWLDDRNGGDEWLDDPNGGYNIYAQRYLPNGTPLGNNFRVNDNEGSAVRYGHTGPSISTDLQGNFVITWQDGRNLESPNYNYDIYAQRYLNDGSPLGPNFKVNDDEGNVTQSFTSVSSAANGNFVITWTDYRDGLYEGIYAQRYLSDGTPVGNNFKVNDSGSGSYYFGSSISVAVNGDFIITWSDSYNGPFAQRFLSDGSRVGANFKVKASTNYNEYPAISIDGNNNFVITWWEYRNEAGGLYAQRYLSDGSPIGNNFKVMDEPITYSDVIGNLSISADYNGNFIIIWDKWSNMYFVGKSDIYAQRYLSDGSRLGDNFLITSTSEKTQYLPEVKLWNGLIYNTWTDNRAGGTNFDIWANVLDWNNPVGIKDKDPSTAPSEFYLSQNYPNPFNPSTKISWQSPVGSQQTLTVFDVLGNEVATLVDEEKEAGYNSVDFNASDLPSGVYFYQLKAGSFIETKKMILLR